METPLPQLWHYSCGDFANLDSPDDLHAVDAGVVLAWREHLTSLELSNSSIANRLSALSSLFKHFCDKQIVQINPVQGIKRCVCVQVKSGDSALDRPTPDQLIGTMQNVQASHGLLAVSYTHLTLPTNREV